MSLLQRAIISQMTGADTWPEDAALYQPFEDRQILLNENAPCLAAQVYLHMCELEVKVISRSNAEFMALNGKLPLLKCCDVMISGPTAIIDFLKQKGYSLDKDLTELQKVDLQAYTELVNYILIPSQLFVTWIDDKTYTQSTCKRYGHPYSWPLNRILCWQKRNDIARYLKAVGWKRGKKTMTSVEDDIYRCCMALSEKLGDKQYFFGTSPTSLDALVFGHLFTILTTRLPDNRLAEMVRKFDNLVTFCQYIDKTYFTDGDDNEDSHHSTTE